MPEACGRCLHAAAFPLSRWSGYMSQPAETESEIDARVPLSGPRSGIRGSGSGARLVTEPRLDDHAYRRTARSRAFRASSSRFLGAALVVSVRTRRSAAAVT